MKKIIQILILFHCISWKVSAQPNWSVEDLHVTAFRNGESLMQANSIDNWKYCSANQIPAYYLIGDSPEDGVLYNYYALINDQQLAPEGYRIVEIDDLKALPKDRYYQSTDGNWNTNTGTGFFNANANGYLPFEGETFELLSQGDAAYYWTLTVGKPLYSMGFVIMNGEKGYSDLEIRRESFCAVRCVKNEAEASAFDKSESEILAARKKREEEKLLAEEKARKEAEEKRLAEEKAKKDAADKKRAEEQAKRDAEEKRQAEEKFKKEQSENKNILGGNTNINSTSQNGNLLIWISSDLECGKINVTVNNITKTITNFHQTEPSCNAVGCAVFSLPPGEYKVDAECRNMKWSFTRKVVSNECNRTRLKGNGQLMIWVSSDLGCGQIEVTVNGITQIISSSYKSAPDCGANGCANFTLPAGEYNVSAKCNNMTWSFTKKVSSEECTKTELIKSNK